jgi:hypothetical protein
MHIVFQDIFVQKFHSFELNTSVWNAKYLGVSSASIPDTGTG